MNKLFTMARQLGTTMRQKIVMFMALELASRQNKVTLAAPRLHYPEPDHRNSTAAADKRCARRRRNIAKRRG